MFTYRGNTSWIEQSLEGKWLRKPRNNKDTGNIDSILQVRDTGNIDSISQVRDTGNIDSISQLSMIIKQKDNTENQGGWGVVSLRYFVF
jgi:hypothetical protein